MTSPTTRLLRLFCSALAIACSHSAWAASADDIAKLTACLKVEVAKVVASKSHSAMSAEASVRCEGGGWRGNGDFQEGWIVANPPNQYLVRDPVSVVDFGTNSGMGGFDAPVVDPAGRFSTARIYCRSPNQVGGPGSWAFGKLQHFLEYYTNIDERRQLAEKCYDAILR